VETDLFEQTILPHLDAAYNLARWLAGNEHDARDIVQEAALRAFKFFGGFRGGDARAWLLAIVRNTAFTKMRAQPAQDLGPDDLDKIEDTAPQPAQVLERAGNIEAMRAAIAKLPVEFREVIVFREMENFSYKEIAELVNAPIGTVMSRLARARAQLREIILADANLRETRS